MTVRRWMLVSAVAAVALLTACNPLLGQPTMVREKGLSRSGRVVYTGTVPGWLEVSVRDSPEASVSVFAAGRDETRPDLPWSENDCFFATDAVPAWSDGTSLGFKRLERIGPGTELKFTFTAPTEGTTFDVRVVDDAGVAVGDVTHQVPVKFEDVGGAICP